VLKIFSSEVDAEDSAESACILSVLK
jgi:hypothetical protein